MPAPSQRLILLFAIIVLMAIAIPFWPELQSIWYSLIAILSIISLFDLARLYQIQNPKAERITPAALSVARQHTIHLRIHNSSHKTIQCDITDAYPDDMECNDLPQALSVKPNGWTETQYILSPNQRGAYHFDNIYLRLLSSWGLWSRTITLAAPHRIRIYPDFTAISTYALTAVDNQLSRTGVKRHRRRGDGSEFLQLRDYREGDAMKNIDWKASARFHKVVTREYEDEKNQEIICLLDCSYRMRSQDGELSHFDHTLNAILLLAHIVTRQGDSIGLSTFGGVKRWLPPQGGKQSLNRLLNTLYDIQPGHTVADYHAAAIELFKHQKKRALILLITNVRQEDSDDAQAAIKLLSRKHRVLLVNLYEEILDTNINQDIDSFEQAIQHASTAIYNNEQAAMIKDLRQRKITTINVPPKELSAKLLNTYTELKAGGTI